jgi:hypothetical protein
MREEKSSGKRPLCQRVKFGSLGFLLSCWAELHMYITSLCRTFLTISSVQNETTRVSYVFSFSFAVRPSLLHISDATVLRTSYSWIDGIFTSIFFDDTVQFLGAPFARPRDEGPMTTESTLEKWTECMQRREPSLSKSLNH